MNLRYFKGFLPGILITVVCAMIGAAMTIIGPSAVKELTNIVAASLYEDIDMERFVRIASIIFALFFVGSLATGAQSFITANLTAKMSLKLRGDIDKKINSLPLAYFDHNSTGDILSRVTNDVDTISDTLGSSMASIISAIALFFGVVIMMFVTNWILALVTIGTSVLGFFGVSFVLKKSRSLFKERQKRLGALNGRVEEIYSNYLTVRAYNGKGKETDLFEKDNSGIYGVSWKAQFLSGSTWPIFGLVGNLAYVLIFIVGASIIASHGTGVDLGTLMAFVMYARIFSQPLQTFGQSMSALQQASAAAGRVFALLKEQELEAEIGKIEKIDHVDGAVSFENIRFGYAPDKTIIHDFSASLKPGQKVAIVGPTGAGKTTIVNLLMRFYEPDSGRIVIDGVATSGMTRSTVHSLFDMILQDTWLFKGTVRENLTYGKQGVSDEELIKACQAVGLGHFIDTLPGGLDAVIDGESSLSSGQKQQLTIARAIIKDSPLLILDEATSNVDTRTELAISRAMDELTKGRTSFIIAHRLSTIRDADIILVMKDGDIVEQGKHEELLAKKGFYAEIYNSQFTKSEDI